MDDREQARVLKERLVAARAKSGMTQEELASQAGVSQSFVSQLERGEIDNPGWITIRNLERALGVRPGHLTRESAA